MEHKLQHFAQALQCAGGPVERMKAAAAALFERIKLFALFTKHRGFHEEREWRIVYLREQDRDGLFTQQLHYAIGPRGIEPRLRFTTVRSVVRMLELYQPAWADRVARSSTPYRSQR